MNTFELVLYYNRNTFSIPVEPSYQNIKDNNPGIEMDDVLDIYSEQMRKFKEDSEKYSQVKNSNKVIQSHVLIVEDDNVISNIHEFEQKPFFISWTSTSKKVIESTINTIIR